MKIKLLIAFLAIGMMANAQMGITKRAERKALHDWHYTNHTPRICTNDSIVSSIIKWGTPRRIKVTDNIYVGTLKIGNETVLYKHDGNEVSFFPYPEKPPTTISFEDLIEYEQYRYNDSTWITISAYVSLYNQLDMYYIDGVVGDCYTLRKKQTFADFIN